MSEFALSLPTSQPFVVSAAGFAKLSAQSLQYTEAQARQALDADKPDLAALLSPAAEPLLADMLARASSLKRQRFGATVELFAPLYLSNLCSNECSYCGFSRSVAIKRTILSPDDIATEADAVAALGIRQLLLVTGEHERKAGTAYLLAACRQLRPRFASLWLEAQPLSVTDYRQLRTAGIDAVMLYQETYDPQSYARHHTFGRKADMQWRLDAPARVGAAGIARLGMGVLLGLSDWRADVLLLCWHLRWLQKHYPQLAISLALPRLQPCAGATTQQSGVSDRHYLQILCALKIVAPDVSLSISTRDRPALRDLLLGTIASVASAGSKTQPGGYALAPENLAQFDIEDRRSPAQIAAMLQQQGQQVLWQDWHPAFGRAAPDNDREIGPPESFQTGQQPQLWV